MDFGLLKELSEDPSMSCGKLLNAFSLTFHLLTIELIHKNKKVIKGACTVSTGTHHSTGEVQGEAQQQLLRTRSFSRHSGVLTRRYGT